MEVNNNHWLPVQGKYYDIDVDLNGRIYEIVELDKKPNQSAQSILEKIERVINLNFKPLNLDDPDKILKISKQIHHSLKSKFHSSLVDYDPTLKKNIAVIGKFYNLTLLEQVSEEFLKISRFLHQSLHSTVLPFLTNNNKMNKINALHICIERASYPCVSLPGLDETIQLVLKLLPFKDLNSFCIINRDAKKHGDINVYNRAKELGHDGCDVKSSYVFFKQIFVDFEYYQACGDEEMISINLENILNQLKNLKNLELFKLICDGWFGTILLLLSNLKVEDSLEEKIEELSDEERKLGEKALLEMYSRDLSIEFLLKRGIKINVKATDGFRNSFLHLAVKKNDCQMVKKLLTQKPDIDLLSSCGKKTALHFANTPEIAMLLIENSADVNKCGTVLHRAKTPEMIEFFCEKGLDINQCDFWKMTPLHAAIINNKGFDCVRFLLEKGASIDCVNSRGYTALQEAKNFRRSPEIIKLLEIRKVLATDCTIF